MPDRGHSALLVVDLQIDFMPGGALAVAAGDTLVRPIGAVLESGKFSCAVATQDWHPPDHISFASSHARGAPFETIELYGHEQTLWPDHCVVGSPGAALHPSLPLDAVTAIIRKGTDPSVDSYSAFRNNWNPEGARPPTGLSGFLRELGIAEVYVCGLARDVCVRWTAEDAADFGFRTLFLWDLTRPVDPSNDSATRAALEARGIEILDAAAIE